MNPNQSSSDKIQQLLVKAFSARYLIFFAFLAIIYLFLIFKVVTLSHAQPSSVAVKVQTNSLSGTQIDPAIINKINQLQNNSVSVNSLFNQARQNPFQE